MKRNIVIVIFLIFLFNYELSALKKTSRQKRCIVIQKQSSGRDDTLDNSDDEDYDYKKPMPKEPMPDRLQTARIGSGQKEVETISPELLKYKDPPKKGMFKRLRMKNRLKNFF